MFCSFLPARDREALHPVLSRMLSFSLLIALLTGACRQENDRPPTMDEKQPPARIICFGNSLTAGFGIDPYAAYPALLQEKIDSLGLPYRTFNAGISGETARGGDERVEWVLREPFAVFILELGVNDLLLGVPPSRLKADLRSIIQKARKAEPKAVILLVETGIHPELAGETASAYRKVYEELAERENLHLLSDWLTPVWANPSLLLPDGLHPNAAGQERLADRIWEYLRPLL